MAIYIRLHCKDKNGNNEICGLKIRGVETNSTSDEDAFETASFYLPDSFKFIKAEYISAHEWVNCQEFIIPETGIENAYNRGKLLEIP